MQLPTLQSTSQYWIDWHSYLKRELGKEGANDTFMRAWQQVGQNSNANNAELRAYAKTQGMNIEGQYFLASGLADVWQSTNTGAKKIGSSFSIGVILLILMMVAAVYFLFLKD
jgi:hypothetical protein